MNPLFSRLRTQASPAPGCRLARLLDQAGAVVVGRGPGLSTSAGFVYGGDQLPAVLLRLRGQVRLSGYIHRGLSPSPTLEEHWAYWGRDGVGQHLPGCPQAGVPNLRDLLVDRTTSSSTTNVDHCFQRRGLTKAPVLYPGGLRPLPVLRPPAGRLGTTATPSRPCSPSRRTWPSHGPSPCCPGAVGPTMNLQVGRHLSSRTRGGTRRRTRMPPSSPYTSGAGYSTWSWGGVQRHRDHQYPSGSGPCKTPRPPTSASTQGRLPPQAIADQSSAWTATSGDPIRRPGHPPAGKEA